MAACHEPGLRWGVSCGWAAVLWENRFHRGGSGQGGLAVGNRR